MRSFLLGFVFGLMAFVLCSAIYLREGQNSTAPIRYNIDGKYIREGQMSTGRILYNIDGCYIREGQMSTGRIVYNITKN